MARPRLAVLLLLAAVGCNDTPTTATGPQSGPLPGPSFPTDLRYALHLEQVDTTVIASATILQVTLRVRTREGLAVVAAEVDLGVTEGQVTPENSMMASDGTVTATWSIPAGRLVANLYGCARPPGLPCATGPLMKWNQ